ncbi:CAP domain-containing protein [Acrocarpospora catenulata]|uniref:CAP domain-containing protein n=1 Tax=Acrocarpospora catenulata TaxID=2836182 RepID=UPI001BDA1137|nr:CAP domain-containing protein [Acrocarpospora catenulata]
MPRTLVTVMMVAVVGGCGGNGVVAAGDLTEESPVPVDSFVVPTPYGERDTPRRKATKSDGIRAGSGGESRTAAAMRSAEDEAVRLTNVVRRREGCRPLRTDERLRVAARGHSAEMAARGYLGHESLDGRSPWDRIKEAGYAYPAAENLAQGPRGARAVVNAWLESPRHRTNLVNCRLRAIGVGVRLGVGGPWWTQDFGYR